MKRVQMAKRKMKFSTKNSLNLNSHGITLMSLIIYITLMFVVLALIMRVSTYFTKNISDATDTTFEEEFQKFNMYMLQETNKKGNYVVAIEEDGESILFNDENKFVFNSETKEIYYNEIIICKNVDGCKFSIMDDVTVDIAINGTQKKAKYVMELLAFKLPAEFQEVEYIESTGTQYIDTGIKTSSDIRTEVEFMPTGWGGVVFGNYMENGLISNSNNLYISLQSEHYIYSTDEGNANNRLVLGEASLGTKYHAIVDLKNKKAYFEGTENDFINDAIWEGQNNLLIFARTYNDIGYFGSFKLYNCKIYVNNVLQANFIPCYNKTNNKIGLYNLVNNEFYENVGSGAFLKGNDVNTNESEKNYIVKTKIPKAYQEVEYIESTGTQYIDLNITGDKDLDILVDVQNTKESKSNTAIISRNASSGRWYGISGSNNNYYLTDINSLIRKEILISFNNDGFTIKINGTSYYKTDTIEIYSGSRYLLFAAINKNGIIGFFSKLKLYKVVLIENGETIRDMVPCYRKSDNVIGMYDTVNDKFYTNDGTGIFIIGPEVY